MTPALPPSSGRSAIIWQPSCGGSKLGVSQWARQVGLPFGWQPRYHDRVIRSDTERARIEWSIDQNPARWAEEHLLPDGIFR